MKPAVLPFFAAVLLALFTAAQVQARELPRLDRRVVDEAGVLDPSEESRIERQLASYEQRTGHQMAVVVLRSLDGDVLEQVSLRAAEQWRLGDAKRDDGVLVLLAMRERAARIEVGYGLEGAVTDAVASRVIRDVMAPQLVNGHVAAAIEAGLDVLMRAAEGESTGLAPSTTSPNVNVSARHEPSWVQLAPITLFLVVMVLSAMGRRRRGHALPRGGGLAQTLWWTSVLGGVGRSYGGSRGFGGGGFFGGGSGGGFGGGGASGRW